LAPEYYQIQVSARANELFFGGTH